MADSITPESEARNRMVDELRAIGRLLCSDAAKFQLEGFNDTGLLLIQAANEIEALAENREKINDEYVERFARYMVDVLGMLPANPTAGRFSGGHNWHRATMVERNHFRAKAREILKHIYSENND